MLCVEVQHVSVGLNRGVWCFRLEQTACLVCELTANPGYSFRAISETYEPFVEDIPGTVKDAHATHREYSLPQRTAVWAIFHKGKQEPMHYEKAR